MGNDMSIAEINEGIEERDFTLDELAQADGKGETPVYVAIHRKVFDVSSRKDDLYGHLCPPRVVLFKMPTQLCWPARIT